MASSFNRISVTGYAGRDAEMRVTASGDSVANFSIATTSRRTVNGEVKEETTWFRVSLFGRLAEIAKDYVKKGSYVEVSGPVKSNEYTDSTGGKKFTMEITARELNLLGGKPGDSTAERPLVGASVSAPESFSNGSDDTMDDIPF